MNEPPDRVDPLARLLEGLLNDPDARARFRREPAVVCRELGLDDAAEQLSGGAKALHTLELRESKSSLAGLLLAAAAEGVGLADLVHHVYEHLNGDTARLAGQALTRAGLPAVHEAVTRAGLPAVQQPLEPTAGGSLAPEQLSDASAAPVPAPLDVAGAGVVTPPVDLASPSADASSLLASPQLGFSPAASNNLLAGGADPRMISALSRLGESHRIEVSAANSDGSFDISAVDGRPVSTHNVAARVVAEELASLDERIRPSQVGSPWPMSGATFTADPGSIDKIRVAFSGPAPAAGGGGTVGLPAVSQAGGAQEVAADQVAGSALAEGAPNPVALSAVTAAMRMIHTPYVWGAETPRVGFDCSGLVQWAYHQAGHPIGRTTWDQIKDGKPVQWGEFKPGDLIFSNFEGGSDPTHVVMYIGNGKVIAAPHTGASVEVEPVSWFKDYYVGARRIEPLTASSGDAMPDAQIGGAVVAQAQSPAGGMATVGGLQVPAQAGTASPTNTVQFMPAVADPKGSDPAHVADLHSGAGLPDPTDAYPGDHAPQQQIAAWMARQAERAGLPPELPVMAALTESGLRNLDYGDSTSVGYFQMLSNWNEWGGGKYRGFASHPELQLQWFIDHALAYKHQYAGRNDAHSLGDWAADVERPLAAYRGRYEPRYKEARRLISGR
jgi:cell wall-associated NlpC family hydrolase